MGDAWRVAGPGTELRSSEKSSKHSSPLSRFSSPNVVCFLKVNIIARICVTKTVVCEMFLCVCRCICAKKKKKKVLIEKGFIANKNKYKLQRPLQP